MAKEIYLGVDVGSGSVRVVALDEKGTLLSSAVEDLEINRPRQDYYEQSSTQIWDAVCQATRKVIDEIGPRNSQVKGIGFDATCSLVSLDKHGNPLSVSPTNEPSCTRIWDIIMWMDHRAIDEADCINCTKHPRLRYVGESISPEMEPPKLLWLKENKPEIWSNIGHVMDLADFLTYKATGSLVRSQCTVVCKWLYEAENSGGQWDKSFWTTIGLQEFADSSSIIGSEIQFPGTLCGYLSPEALAQLNLPPSHRIPVAVGIIDAHAGVLGLLGASIPNHAHMDIEEKLCMISGTSVCHMVLSKKAPFINGVWGPNYGVIFDGYWCNEAGQNALGPVLDEIVMDGNNQGSTLSDLHKKIIDQLLAYEQNHGALNAAELTRDLHVWPDYRGNRSPLADPNCKGVIAGLRLKADMETYNVDATTINYLAHIQSFAYMTRYIMETISYAAPQRKPFSIIYLCGGLQKNPIYVQTHADVCRMPIVVPVDTEVVARGSAILGAYASGRFNSLMDAVETLKCVGRVVNPRSETFQYHDKKYKAFRILGKTETDIRRIMNMDV